MKATLEIPDPLYVKAAARAKAFGQSMRDFLVTLLQRELEGPAPGGAENEDGNQKPVYSTTTNGFLVLNRPTGSPVITDALVNQMRLEQGI